MSPATAPGGSRQVVRTTGTPGDAGLRIRRGPAPEPPGPDWCLVRVTMAGICGSDLPDPAGDPPAGPEDDAAPSDEPLSHAVAVGHEIVGRVEHPGADSGWAVGDRVVVHPLVACEARGEPPCRSCREGWYGQCRSFWEGGTKWGKSLGFSRELGGGWGDVVAVHRSMLRAVPDTLPDRTAVLAEPLSVALSGMRHLAGTSEEGPLVILGGGTIGLLTAVAAAAMFPDRRRWLIARHPFQAEAARSLGPGVVEPLLSGPGGGADRLPASPTAVVDAVGSGQSLSEALAVAGTGGTVLTLGNPERCDDLRALWLKRLTLIGHLEHGTLTARDGRRVDSMAEAVRLLTAMPRLGDVLTTHRYPLEELRTALAVARHRAEHRAVKVALVP
ncbi:zinc-binding dehydrogenase [Streptomyces sp. NBC_00247]|uniref:zinc-dependent alcohol dehydrogenase n=1 Tax=Streptomyces sp. NBC_00247 TaxID=2975689 RepID=UPI002E2CBD36|nr:zinc-binding dehydrogenase [Streptomyces sp. NBC_00247]